MLNGEVHGDVLFVGAFRDTVGDDEHVGERVGERSELRFDVTDEGELPWLGCIVAVLVGEGDVHIVDG